MFGFLVLFRFMVLRLLHDDDNKSRLEFCRLMSCEGGIRCIGIKLSV
jgi:hypothetical protein